MGMYSVIKKLISEDLMTVSLLQHFLLPEAIAQLEMSKIRRENRIAFIYSLDFSKS